MAQSTPNVFSLDDHDILVQDMRKEAKRARGIEVEGAVEGLSLSSVNTTEESGLPSNHQYMSWLMPNNTVDEPHTNSLSGNEQNSFQFTDWTLIPDEFYPWGTEISSSDFFPSVPAQAFETSNNLLQPSPNQSFITDSSNFSNPSPSPYQLFDGFGPNNSTEPRRPSYSTAPSTPESVNTLPSPNANMLPQDLLPLPVLKTFTCSHEGCGKIYKTKNNLQRHKKGAKHGPSHPAIPYISDTKKYDCPHDDCDRKGEIKGFSRKDNMIQHQRLVHNTEIAKRTRRKGDAGITKRQ